MLLLELMPDPSLTAVPAGTVQARALGAYLGLAVGDALGATVEFMLPREIAAQYRVHRDLIGGGWLKLRRGQVTDDTEMSLALGQAILDTGGVAADPIAAAFSDWMRTKPVDIGNTVRRGLVRYRRTGEPLVPESPHDAGNGACMRALPIALATLGADLETLAAANRTQSHTTHHNALADAGTLTVLRMVQTAIAGGGRDQLKDLAETLVAEVPEYAYDRRRQENPSGYLVETLRAVFQSLFATDSFEGALIDVVNRGGDADTTGAILGMIAGALYGLGAIPRRWLAALDPRIAAACRTQTMGLLALSPALRRN